jgi:molecular chaperone HscB
LYISMDHFELLGLPRSYALDLNHLETKYLEACKANHPDFHLAPSALAQALRKTAEINQAYQTLKDSFSRAEYLLKLNAGPSSEQIREVPSEILEQVMEWRMDLEEILGNPQKQAEVLSLIRQKMFFLEELLLKEFKKLELSVDEFMSESLGKIRVSLNSMKYLKNLLDELNKGA